MVILQFPPEIFKLINPKEFEICAATTFSVVVVSLDWPCTILESSCSFVSRRRLKLPLLFRIDPPPATANHPNHRSSSLINVFQNNSTYL